MGLPVIRAHFKTSVFVYNLADALIVQWIEQGTPKA